jgi:hypothetical protein
LPPVRLGEISLDKAGLHMAKIGCVRLCQRQKLGIRIYTYIRKRNASLFQQPRQPPIATAYVCNREWLFAAFQR